MNYYKFINKCDHQWDFSISTSDRVCVECGLAEGEGKIIHIPVYDPRPRWDVLYDDYKYFFIMVQKLEGSISFYDEMHESTVIWIKKNIEGNPPNWKKVYKILKPDSLQDFIPLIPQILGHPLYIPPIIFDIWKTFKMKNERHNNVNAMWLIWKTLSVFGGEPEWVPMKLTQATIDRLDDLWIEYM